MARNRSAGPPYDITYPTVRLRLDRLIEKIKILDDQEIQSDFERVPRAPAAEQSPWES